MRAALTSYSAIRTVASLCLAGALAACATVPADPDNHPAVTGAPANWAALEDVGAGEARLAVSWVEDFNDPALPALLLEALNTNYNLAGFAARADIAREGAISTRSALLPSLTGSISKSRSMTTDSTGILSGTPGKELYSGNSSLGASLAWEADVWGRLRDGTKAAWLDAAAAENDFAAARLSIAGGVAQSWYGLIAARLQRELAERDVETGETNLRITERRYKSGVSNALDVRLARSSLASSKASLIAARQSEQEAARALETLLGRYPSAELAAHEALPSLPAWSEEGNWLASLGTPAQMLDRRPDVLAAEQRLQAAGFEARAARKALFPSLSLTGSAGNNEADIGDLLNFDNLVSSIAASLTQPIYQGGRLRAQARLSEAAAEAAAADYASTVLGAFQEVENALAAEELLAAREDALFLAFEEAKASEELTERQYLNGTRTIFNLIDAQQRRIGAESGYISAQQARLNNRVSLYLALGGTLEVAGEQTRATGKKETEQTDKERWPLFRKWWVLGQGQSGDPAPEGAG